MVWGSEHSIHTGLPKPHGQLAQLAALEPDLQPQRRGPTGVCGMGEHHILAWMCVNQAGRQAGKGTPHRHTHTQVHIAGPLPDMP